MHFCVPRRPSSKILGSLFLGGMLEYFEFGTLKPKKDTPSRLFLFGGNF